MESLRAPAGLSNTGYPTLTADDPPAYGVLNPRPSASAIQAGGGDVPAGGLFGEHVSGNADASLFQPNISPDVVTVAVTVPDAYFPPNVDTLHVTQGTVVCLGPRVKTLNRWHSTHRSRSEDTGALHCAHFGKFIGAQPFESWTSSQKATYKQSYREATMVTTIVGPVDVRKGRTVYMAVAVQNVSHVSYACIPPLTREGARVGDRMYFSCTDNALPHVAHVPEGNHVTREITLMLPMDLPRLGTASFDIGAHLSPTAFAVEP
tara:strand:+ start:1468 stop:2256 length:789 start_codon:yes stop_codon:yes gene_type:complete